MLERRSTWLAIILLVTVCLSLWQMIGCPGPPLFASPTYQILTQTNATDSPAPYSVDALPEHDYSTLIDLVGFRFNMLPSKCATNESDSLLLLVVVHSAVANLEKRMAIRETWGERTLTTTNWMRLLFMIGDNETLELDVAQEYARYGDLVQGNFIDAYRNMTYKHVMALKYAIYHCPQAKYILKTDDDVFVNMVALLSFLRFDLSQWGARRLLLCNPLYNSVVKRSYRSKWRVAPHEYPARYYPPYCPGWAILYSPDVAFILYREAQMSTYFWIDDVLITGILVVRAHLQHTPIGNRILTNRIVDQLIEKSSSSNSNNSLINIIGDKSVLSSLFLYGPPDMDRDRIQRLWNVLQMYYHHHHARKMGLQ